MEPVETTQESGGGLFTHERRQQIARLVEEQQRVTVPELSGLFSVSEVTIRKDLAWLEERRLLVRTHGGAVLAPPGAQPFASPNEQDFAVRERLQHSEKDLIGRMAAELVQDGDSIALDASTTALAMANYLRERRELTVVTNGLRTGLELVTSPSISVLFPGGMLRQEAFSLVGSWGRAILKQVHIKKVFIGAKGFTLEEGLTDVNSEEVELKRVFVEAAREVTAIIDHSKWGQIALATFCPPARIKRIITDAKAPPALVEEARNQGIEVLIAQA